jgi:non-ribosomal peptide synthetase component E (peptide arylation enzyme)
MRSEGVQAVRFAIPGVTYHAAQQIDVHRASGAWVWSTFGNLLRDAARECGDRDFIVAEDGSFTFAELDRKSESVAAGLVQLGLAPGDRAIFQVGTVKEIVVALFGCFKAGVVPVCTLPQYREIEIGQLARLSGASAYFVQADFSPAFDLAGFARRMMVEHEGLRHLILLRGPAAPGEHSLEELSERHTPHAARAATRGADPAPGDVAMFQLSGGSTGVPKIIPRMHAEYLGSSAAWNARHQLTEADTSLWALPLIHNAGMIVMLIPSLLRRSTLVIRARFEVRDFLGAIEHHRVSYTGSIGPIAPSIIDLPDAESFDLSSLRLAFTLARADGLEGRIGVAAQVMYGITEGMLMACFPDEGREARHRTIGWPTGIGDEVRLLAPGSEQDVPLGTAGEFCFRGPHTLCAYFNAPEITAVSFTSDGFFRTGDLVRASEIDGRIHYVFEGRLKDNISRGGEKFGAEEVEALIVAHPAINDARVVAMPDPLMGERACAFLILKAGHDCPTVATLGAFLQGKGLAKFKLPERIEVIAEFPVTRVGKVDKQALRKIIAEKTGSERALRNAS